MASNIRVVIVEDEAPFRHAIQKTLSLAPEIEILKVCKDGQEGLEYCLQNPPDVLLTDVNMPRMDGIEMIRKVLRKEKDVKPVILTVAEEETTVYEAIRAGAIGYLLKSSRGNDIISAVRHAVKGEAFITPRIATLVLSDFKRVREDEREEDAELYVLSEREAEILDLIAQGLRNKEIASRLGIAEKTVKNHVSNILKALQVNSRTEAAMKALKAKLVESN